MVIAIADPKYVTTGWDGVIGWFFGIISFYAGIGFLLNLLGIEIDYEG